MGLRSTFQDSSDEGFVTRKPMDEEMDLDITPMIDVTFLLLIFFMVTSTMKAEKDHRIPHASFAEAIQADKATIVMLEYDGSPTREPIIKLPGDLTATLEQLTAAVEKAKTEENKVHVIVRADGRIPAGHMNKVMLAIAEVKEVNFSMGVREKK